MGGAVGSLGAAIGGAVSGLQGGLAGGFLSSRAARAQRKGLAGIAAAQSQRLSEAQARLEPFREAGLTALDPLTALVTGRRFDETTGEFTDVSPQERERLIQTSPGFEFRLEQGQKALERLASARGDVFSGRQLLAAQSFGQQEASSEFDKILARLGSLAGSGQQAAAQQGGFAISALPQFTTLGSLAVGTSGAGRRAAGQAFGQFGQDLAGIGGFASGGGFGSPGGATPIAGGF